MPLYLRYYWVENELGREGVKTNQMPKTRAIGDEDAIPMRLVGPRKTISNKLEKYIVKDAREANKLKWRRV